MNFQKEFAGTAEGPAARFLRHACVDPPRRYTTKVFLKRLAHHFFLYSALLALAVFVVMFIYRPIETGIILAVLVGLYKGISDLAARDSSSRGVRGIYAAMNISPVILYILAASFLWKEITDGALSKIVEHSLFRG